MAALDVLLVVSAAALTALAAQVVIYLPFTPVPITGQTFAVLLVGATLGRLRGAGALLLYAFVGAAGFGVFAGGEHGVSVILGPTGGYIVGFIFASYIVGLLVERGWDRGFLGAAGTMALGNLVVYAIGLPWLYATSGGTLCGSSFFGPFIPELVCGSPIMVTLYAGLFPFVVGDIVKLVLAAVMLPLAWRLIGETTTGRR